MQYVGHPLSQRLGLLLTIVSQFTLFARFKGSKPGELPAESIKQRELIV